MRTALIVIQAAILATVAVIGAHGDSGKSHNCPLPAAQTEFSCQE